MIATLWESIAGIMADLGYRIDPTEADALADMHYTIALPATIRNPGDRATTFSRMRVTRDIRIRLQFRDRKDAFFARDIAKEIERVAVAIRDVVLFESSALDKRAGGTIAEVQFSAIDCMN